MHLQMTKIFQLTLLKLRKHRVFLACITRKSKEQFCLQELLNPGAHMMLAGLSLSLGFTLCYSFFRQSLFTKRKIRTLTVLAIVALQIAIPEKKYVWYCECLNTHHDVIQWGTTGCSWGCSLAVMQFGPGVSVNRKEHDLAHRSTFSQSSIGAHSLWSLNLKTMKNADNRVSRANQRPASVSVGTLFLPEDTVP